MLSAEVQLWFRWIAQFGSSVQRWSRWSTHSITQHMILEAEQIQHTARSAEEKHVIAIVQDAKHLSTP